jgi:hypothetical protein
MGQAKDVWNELQFADVPTQDARIQGQDVDSQNSDQEQDPDPEMRVGPAG